MRRIKYIDEIYKQKWQKWKFFCLVIVPAILILITNSCLLTNIEGAELTSVGLTFPSTDSLKITYKNIDASNFPYIVSHVTVTNDIGFVIEKLDENNFEVREDSVRELPIEVVELFDPKIDVNVVLTIDQSNSMRGQPIQDARAAASMFVGLMQGKDQAAIVSFAREPNIIHLFSNDKDSLTAAISGINIEGGTAIFDALICSADLTRSILKNRVIILMTDGGDNSSQYSYEEALNTLISLEVRVFTIGLGLERDSSEERVLKNLAGATGGIYYYSPTSSDLEEIYRAISMLLHHRYRISYTTHNPAKDGTLR
ncbi:MAG: VWA domain-containing protein, partial [bacterium]